MKKLIAKTRIGKEFMYSRESAFFADKNAEKVADILNKNKYQLKEGECWYVYDYDFGQDLFVTEKIFIAKNGSIKVAHV